MGGCVCLGASVVGRFVVCGCFVLCVVVCVRVCMLRCSALVCVCSHDCVLVWLFDYACDVLSGCVLLVCVCVCVCVCVFGCVSVCVVCWLCAVQVCVCVCVSVCLVV